MLRKIRNIKCLTPIIKVRDRFMEKCGLFKWKAKWKKKMFYFQLKWEDANFKKKVEQKLRHVPAGTIDGKYTANDVIISVTSYGKRVSDTLPYMLYSLLEQTKLPHKVLVYLDKNHWSDGQLPPILKECQRIGIDFVYCDDLLSYKKLIPALKMFPDNPIITFDDDFYYNPHIIEWLIRDYKKSDKRTVIGSWGGIVEYKDGEYAPYTQWKDCAYRKGDEEISLYAGNGTIYPPHLFDEEISNKDVFLDLAPTADDIWFWVMEKKAGIKIQLIPEAGGHINRPVNRIDAFVFEKGNALYYENCVLGKNDEQFYKLVEKYLCKSK